MAECHPVGFQWVEEARARGARVIHVDPRFTRTSAVSDKHIPIRAGSDVVLLGALINHVLTNDLWFKEYVVAYTNAATLINENYRDSEDLGGLFPGSTPPRVNTTNRRGLTRKREPGERHSRRRGQSTAQVPRRAPPGMRTAVGVRRYRIPGATRRDSAAPADGVPDPQAAFRPLHAGDGARRLWHQPRGFPLPRPVHHRELRSGAHHLFHLCPGLDSTHTWCPNHPDLNDFAAAAGQCRPPG